MHFNDFDFELPQHMIARYPLSKRTDSRLLCINQQIIHTTFAQVAELVHEDDLLVFNDTKVIPARLKGAKVTGGKVEVLVERVLDERRILAQLKMSKKPRLNETLYFAEGVQLQIVQYQEPFYELMYPHHDRTILEILETIGQIPLPPYMHRTAEALDKERYQTVYAKYHGSVAAPTAGFHFDETLLQSLREKNVQFGYLTLHIGAGTFMPVRATDITQHKMHSEFLRVSPELCEKIIATKARGKRVIAVGTTSLRALETASQGGTIAPYCGDTTIFIYPGYQFHCVDALITNLHLPRSSLLMLVCAFGGYDLVMRAYQEATTQNYRFYSYGDAMWVEKG